MSKKIVKPLVIALCVVILLVVIVISGYTIYTNRKVSSSDYSLLKESENFAKNANVISSKGKKANSVADGKSYSSWNAKTGEFVEINLGRARTFNTIVIKEGLNCTGSLAYAVEGSTSRFSIFASIDGKYQLIHSNDKIDAYRLCSFDSVTTDKLKFVIDGTRSVSRIKEIEVYNAAPIERDFRVNDYFVYNNIDGKENDAQLRQYSATVTDLTMFLGVSIDLPTGVIKFQENDEPAFAARLQRVKKALSGLNLKYYVNLLSFDAKANEFNADYGLHARSIAEFLVKYQLDGADFDWEYPSSSSDYKVYNEFLVAVGGELHKVDKKLSVAVAAWNANFSKSAKNAVDYFNVMVYDHITDDYNNYHATFKHATLAIEKLIFQKYDVSKLCLGLAYYGRELADINKTGRTIHTDYNMSGITSKWDNYSANGVTYSAEGDKQINEGYFNGFAMIRDKVAYAINMNLGGVMSWHMFTDFTPDHQLSLHNAVLEAISSYIV